MRQFFPSKRILSAGDYLDQYGSEYVTAFASIDRAQFSLAIEILADALKRDVTVFCCGNGGSASIANHLACDHQKGISSNTHHRPKIVSLSSNVELITAVANDVCYDEVFAFPLRLHARPGDVLLTISSSGNSENIVRVLNAAHEIGMRTVAMTGFEGGRSREIAEAVIHVDGFNYGVVEDAHQACMHAIAQYLRHEAVPEDFMGKKAF